MASPLVPAALQRELGQVEVRRPTGVWGDLYESTPELRFPYNMDVYDRMRRQDAQIKSLLRATTLPILGTKWRIAGKNVRPEVRAFVEAELGLTADHEGRLRSRPGGVSWDKILRHVLLMLPMGFAPLCRWYTMGKPDQTGLPGSPKEVAHLNLSPRMPRTIWGFKEDDQGNLQGAWQNIATPSYGIYPQDGLAYGYGGRWYLETQGIYGTNGVDPNRILIDSDHLVLFANEQEGTNWAGESILRSTYKHWLIKDALIRIGALSADRQGMGLPVVTYPKDEDGARATALDIASSVRAGEDSGLALPAGWTLEILGVKGSIEDALRWVEYHDQAASKSLLAMFLDLGHSKGLGSGQTTSAFLDYFLLSEKACIRYVEEVFTEDVIRELVRTNFGPDEAYPALVADDPQSEDEPTAQALSLLVKEGLIQPDQATRVEVARRFGMPTPADVAKANEDGSADDGGGDVVPVMENMPVGKTGRSSLEVQKITMSVKNLVGAGFDKDAAMKYLGLDPLPEPPPPPPPPAPLLPPGHPAAMPPEGQPAPNDAVDPITPERPVGPGPVPVVHHVRAKPGQPPVAAGTDRRGVVLHVGDAVMVATGDGIEPGLVYAGTGDLVAVELHHDEDTVLLEAVERRKVQLLAAADQEHAVPATVMAVVRQGARLAGQNGKAVPSISRRLLSGHITHADAVFLAGWFQRRHQPLKSTGKERPMMHVDGTSYTAHGVNMLLRGGDAGESWLKGVARGSTTAAAASITYDQETEQIRAARGAAGAQAHAWTAAHWTHPNGHPRCVMCGTEGSDGKQCAGAANDGLRTTQPGARAPMAAGSDVASLAARLQAVAGQLAALAAAEAS